MGFLGDIAKAGAKFGLDAVVDGALSYVPGAKAFGTDSPSASERKLAAELEQNYRKAAEDFRRMGVPRPPQRRIALLIGCNYPHDRKHTLRGCVNDATRWAELLTRNYNFECILMTDDALLHRNGWNDPHVPTVDNVTRMLANLISQLRHGDTMFIGFSGHGTRIRDRDGDEADGYDECLVLPDPRNKITLLTDDVLYRNFISRVPEGTKLTAVFDCCRSGGAMDLDWSLKTSRSSSGSVRIGTWHRDQRNKHPCRGEVTLITGCTSEESSLEVSGAGGRGGALSTEMIKILSRHPYNWTYGNFMEAVIGNVFNNPHVIKHQNPQCPTLSSSIPFDVHKRMFGPDQLSGIQLPEKHYSLNHDHTHSKHESKVAIEVPKYLMGLISSRK